MDHRPQRRPLRFWVVSAVALCLLLTGCAQDKAGYPHVGQSEGPTDGSVVRTVALYVGIPLLVALVLAALVLIPSARRRSRYRPGDPWDAAPIWFAGPDDPVAAVQQATPGDVVRGGAGGSW